MANYKETDIIGISRQRACRIIFDNNLDSPITARYDEEKVINTGDSIIKIGIETPIYYVVDLESMIDLRDPVTLELTKQSIPTALVHQAIFSDYINRARIRDRGPAPFGSWVVNETLNTWEPPISKPDEENEWEWYEPSVKWIPIRPGPDFYWDDSLEQWSPIII